MASCRRAWGPRTSGVMLSSAASTSSATAAICARRSTIVQSGQVGRLGARPPVRTERNLLDPKLRLAQLALAVQLELGAALVSRDRRVQVQLPALEVLDDLLELCERLLERHRGDFARQLFAGGLCLRFRRGLSRQGVPARGLFAH